MSDKEKQAQQEFAAALAIPEIRAFAYGYRACWEALHPTKQEQEKKEAQE